MKQLLVAVLLVSACLSPSYADAAVFSEDADGFVTSIQGVEIDGSLFNITFHKNISFNTLFGAVGDEEVFTTQPYFWGNPTGASMAADAILDALGDDRTTGRALYFGSWIDADYFWIPYQTSPGRPLLVQAYNDNNAALHIDIKANLIYPNTMHRDSTYATTADLVWATFQTVTPVPVPAAFWLFGCGLLSLAGISRKLGK